MSKKCYNYYINLVGGLIGKVEHNFNIIADSW